MSETSTETALPAPEFEKRGEIAEWLDATEGLPTANPERRLRYFSPSQFKSFGECQGRWYGEKVLGQSKAETPATKLGREVHRICESVSKFGAVPQDAEQRAAGLARVLEPAIPSQEEVLAGETFIEMEFSYQPEGFPLPLYGLMDKVRRQRKACEDYKTTSDFKYVLSEQELQNNVQAVIYGGYLLSPDGEELGCYGVRSDGTKWVKFRHDYVRTKGSAQYRHAEVILVQPEVDANLQRLAEQANEMVRVAALPFSEVPKNTNACSNYGGCHMKAFCVSRGVSVPGTDPTLLRYYQVMNEKENENMPLPKSLQGGLSAKRAEIAEQSSLNDIDGEGKAATPAASAPAALSRPALPPRTAPVPLPMGGKTAAPTINPPDGIGIDQHVIPPTAAPISSSLDEEINATAAAEAEAAKAAKAAAATAKVGLPGKKKKAEETATPAAAPAEELIQHPEVAAAAEALLAAQAAVDAANADVDAAGDDEDAVDEAELALKKAKRKLEAATAALTAAREKAAAEAKAEAEAKVKAEAEAKAKAEAAAAAAVAPPPAVAQVAQQAPEKTDTSYTAFRQPQKGKKTLYLIGHPTKSPFVLWEDFIAPFTAQVEQDHQVPHWRMIKWENNNVLLTAILAAVRSGAVELPENLVFLGPLNAQQHGTFTEALVPLYDEVVK